MKTLKTFFKKHNACNDGFEFAKDLTLEEFLETCQRGDWILWLFVRTNPESLRELTLAKAHCANTVRHLMTDKRSLNAVDVASAFGEGRATREELADAADAAYAAYAAADAAADAAYAAADADAQSAHAAAQAAVVAYHAAAAGGAATWVACSASRAAQAAAQAAVVAAAAYAAAASASAAGEQNREQNRKQTADICRKFLKIEIWDQSQF